MCIQTNALENLAFCLVKNHIHTSIQEELNQEDFLKILKPEKLPENPDIETVERVVVVVGAGASKNANENLPLGREAAELLKNKFQDTKDLIDEEIEKLSRVYRLEKNDFETILLAIHKFHPKELVDELKSIYSKRYVNSLCYELLAHLFKHRFIDVIINFNFDEVLDQAIEDELIAEEYKKIVFDGDVGPHEDLSRNGKFRIPIYIKPHGTISHPSTLRFTREDYFAIPSEINDVMEMIASGKQYDENDENGKPKPVNLILVGFAMESFEFNHILQKNLPSKSKIISFSPVEPKIPKKLQSGEENRNSYFEVTRNSETETETKKRLDNWFEVLWNKIVGHYKEEYKPRSISRHKVLCSILRYPAIKSEKEYIEKRMYLELALSIAKYKGILNVNQISHDRFGKYFCLFKKIHKADETIIDTCKKFGLKDLWYGSKALSIYDGDADKIRVRPEETTVENEISNCIEKINEYLELDQSNGNVTNTKLEKTLKKLYKSEDSEICPKYTNVYNNIFKSPRIISNNLDLKYQTRKLITDPWDQLFVVAETGEWILSEIKPDGLENRKIILIAADLSLQEQIKKNYNNFGIVEVRNLHWWIHNQHMTISLKKSGNRLIPKRSIYFTRRERTSFINPVLLDKIYDLELILESFSAYYLKAKNNLSYVSRLDIVKETEYLLDISNR